MDILEIKGRVRRGENVSDTERAFLIKNDAESLAAFMLANNPGSVNFTLRKMGYSHLGFEPNINALTRQLQILIDRGTTNDFNEVVKNYQINANGLSTGLLTEIQKQFAV